MAATAATLPTPLLYRDLTQKYQVLVERGGARTPSAPPCIRPWYVACMLLGRLYDQWMRYLDRVYVQYVGACVL